MASDLPPLLLECSNCGMKFETKAQLANHMKKFCKDSEYGSLSTLQQKLEGNNLGKNNSFTAQNLSMDSIRAFVNGNSKALLDDRTGQVSLNELRNRVQADELEFENAKKKYVMQREQELKQEIDSYKLNKEKARGMRQAEEAALMDIMRELEQRREAEMRARFEKEQISHALRDLEKTKLTALEHEKKREIHKLAGEREALRLKEEELMNEIQTLQDQLEGQELLWKEQRDKINTVASGVKVGKNLEVIQKRQAELAKERGEQVAGLKVRKEMLEHERKRIMDDLEKVKKGDTTGIRKSTSVKLAASNIISPMNSPMQLESSKVPEAARKMQEKYNQDIDKLNKLKQEKDSSLNLMGDDELVISQGRVDGITKMLNDAEKLRARDKAQVLSYIKDGLDQQLAQESPQNEAIESTPKTSIPIPPRQRKIPNFGQSDILGHNSNPPRLFNDIEETKANRPNVYPTPGNYPYDTSTMMPAMQYNPYGYPPMPGMMPPFMPPIYPPPYFNPFMPPAPQNDENSKLKKKLKKLQKEIDSKQQDEITQNMQEVLSSLQARVQGIDPRTSAPYSKEDLLPEERALIQLSQQEAQDLKLLSAIPRDSELYRAKLENYKEISQMRVRMEAILQELSLSKLKKTFEREAEQDERKLEQERWIDEQKRNLIVGKIRELPEDNRRQEVLEDIRRYEQPQESRRMDHPTEIIRNQAPSQFKRYDPQDLRRPTAQINPLDRELYRNTTAASPAPRAPTHLQAPTTAARVHTSIFNKGIAIKLEALNDFYTTAPLKVQICIQENDRIARDERGNACIWTSDAINYISTDQSNISRNSRRVPGTNIYGDSLKPSRREGTRNNTPTVRSRNIDISNTTTFYNNFLGELVRSEWRNHLYIVIQILEKSSNRAPTAQSQAYRGNEDGLYVPIAWTVYQVSNPETQTLAWATLDLNLYRPPVIVPIVDLNSLNSCQGVLRMRVFEPGNETLLPPQPLNQNSIRVTRNETAFARLAPFVENLEQKYDDLKLFNKGDGVDFYIDSARFLPDNTTCTKLIVRAFNASIDRVSDSTGGLPDLSSTSYFPSYGYRKEFRDTEMDPTTTVLITILTIDSSNNEVRILGYTAINLFLTADTKEQPEDSKLQEFMLNKGSFQIPIYCAEPYRRVPFGVSCFKNVEVLPAASLLVRIRDAAKLGARVLSSQDLPQSEWYSRGVVVPPPRYEEKAYSTVYYSPSPTEIQLFKDRLSRKDITVREATSNMQTALKARVTRNDDETLDWIDEKLQVTSKTQIIDMRYFAKYNPKIGFRVAINALNNTSGPLAHVVLFSTNPPGNLYKGTVTLQDVKMTESVDWNSSARTPVYLDGYSAFNNMQFDANLHVIVDVRGVNLSSKRPEVSSVGWTLIPVFDSEGYVNSGLFQVPLFKGQVPVSILQELTRNSPWEHVSKLSADKTGPKLMPQMSVIISLIDGQRDENLSASLDIQKINYSYIPKDKVASYIYDQAAADRSLQNRRLATILPARFTPESYQTSVKSAMMKHLGLSDIPV